jgi:hypothetical protein
MKRLKCEDRPGNRQNYPVGITKTKKIAYRCLPIKCKYGTDWPMHYVQIK